jgi:hypothetical protein
MKVSEKVLNSRLIVLERILAIMNDRSFSEDEYFTTYRPTPEDAATLSNKEWTKLITSTYYMRD